MKEYQISGMHCENCVKKIQQAIEKIDGVKSVQVDLDKRKAVVEGEVNEQLIRQAIEKAGYSVSEKSTNRDWSQYKPIIVVFSLIGIVTVLLAVVYKLNLMQVMQVFMAGFFLVFSGFKLLDIREFAMGYASYDLIASKWPMWGYIYVCIELSLGLIYAAGINNMAVNLFTATVMLVGAGGVYRSIKSKRKVKCACLGSGISLPVGKVTLLEDLLMTGMALLMIGL